MNHATTGGSVSCENDILFRHGPLLPKITNLRSSHSSVDPFVKRLPPVTNCYPQNGLNKASDPLASQ